MSKEPTKKFVENYGFICNKCGKIIVDGGKHNNEEDLCNQCKIADLEAKLAERGKEIAIRNKKLNELKNELHKRNESLERKKQQVGDVHKAVQQAKKESARKGREVCRANNEVVQYQKQIRLFKQQLAESEEKVNMLEEHKFYTDNIIQAYADKCKKSNQDKISFAVERLEKVKEFVKENESWEIEGSDYSIVYADDVLDQIDNQIEELKKEMK